MIPGSGWQAAFANVDLPGEVFTEPIVAWIARGDEIAGMIVDWRRRRILRDASDCGEFVGYLMPDDTETRESLEEPAFELARRLREQLGKPPDDG